MSERRKRKKIGELIDEVTSLGDKYYTAVDELTALPETGREPNQLPFRGSKDESQSFSVPRGTFAGDVFNEGIQEALISRSPLPQVPERGGPSYRGSPTDSTPQFQTPIGDPGVGMTALMDTVKSFDPRPRKAKPLPEKKEPAKEYSPDFDMQFSEEVDMQGTSREPDYSGQTVDPDLIQYDGMSLENEGMSYGMSTEEDSLAKQFPEDRKPVAPKKIAANPEAMIRESQEKGVPWQDLLVDAYVADNPWIDRTRIKAAVYNVASRHFNDFTKGGGSPSNYMSRLSRDLRGGRGRRSGGRGQRRGGLASQFFTPRMQEKANALRTARKNQLDFINEQRELIRKNNPTVVGPSGIVKNQKALNDLFAEAQEQSYYARDGEVEAMYRSLPQRFEKDKGVKDADDKPARDTGRVGYYGLQKILISDIQKELARKVKENDPAALELVGKYTTKGKKPSKAAFLAAAEEVYNDAGLYDAVTDQGLRGIQKKAERKRSGRKFNNKNNTSIRQSYGRKD